MSQFNRTPGNARYELLRSFLDSPRHRARRVLEVTQAFWWAASDDTHSAKRAQPAVGPGGRMLQRRHTASA